MVLFQNCGQRFNSQALEDSSKSSLESQDNSSDNTAATSTSELLKNVIESIERGSSYPTVQIGENQNSSFNIDKPGKYIVVIHTPDGNNCDAQSQIDYVSSQGGCWTTMFEAEAPAPSSNSINSPSNSRVKTYELSQGPQMLPTLGTRSGSRVFFVPVDEPTKPANRASANVSPEVPVEVASDTRDSQDKVPAQIPEPTKAQNASTPQASSQNGANTNSKAVFVPPVNPSCGSLRSIPSSSSKCEGSPTLKMIKSFQCIANNYSKITNATPCSQRYPMAWKMDLRPSDKGRNAVDVIKERHGSMTPKNLMYCDVCPGSQNLNKAMTVDVAPGGEMALQRNIEPGIVPSSSFNFANFPQGTDHICLSMEVFIPNDFVGNEAGHKLGYGIWGGDQASGGGTSPVMQVKGQGFVVRNTWNGSDTSLYSYHLNRGGSGRWANQNAPKCDSNTCCIYGDSSQAGKVTKGRWVRIEEEVVLNTIDKPDGYARLWVDGKQVGEITNMLIYEKTAKMKIKGLLINDMWGGSIGNPKNQAKRKENYWLKGYTVYH